MQTSMPERSISLSAASLVTSRPELGVPDVTERRVVIREFPKDEGERDCYRHLLKQMQATPDHPPKTKTEFERTRKQGFSPVTVESFEYAWREAIKVSGANWDQPGRRKR
jgi:hypothetical protein